MRRSETAKICIKLTGGKNATIIAQFEKNPSSPKPETKQRAKKNEIYFPGFNGIIQYEYRI